MLSWLIIDKSFLSINYPFKVPL